MENFAYLCSREMKIITKPYRSTVKRKTMNKKILPGTAFATGRPATGRNHPVTFRISAEALAILSIVPNKSEFVDHLIINSNQKNYGR